jgi:hypothetical protein
MTAPVAAIHVLLAASAPPGVGQQDVDARNKSAQDAEVAVRRCPAV